MNRFSLGSGDSGDLMGFPKSPLVEPLLERKREKAEIATIATA